MGILDQARRHRQRANNRVEEKDDDDGIAAAADSRAEKDDVMVSVAPADITKDTMEMGTKSGSHGYETNGGRFEE